MKDLMLKLRDLQQLIYKISTFLFISSRIKRTKTEGKKCHAKLVTMVSRKADKTLKRNTQHVPLRQNEEGKRRGRGIKVVYDD